MKKIIKYAAMLCGFAAAGLWSCEDPHTANMEDYMSLLYFRNGGVQEVFAITRVEPTAIYNISVCKSGFQTTATASAIVAPMEQTQLDIYNIQNGTDYQLLPEDCFRIVGNENLVFEATDSYKIVELEVDNEKSFAAFEQITATGKTPVIALQLFSNDKLSKGLNYVIYTPSLERAFLSFAETQSSEHYTSNSPQVNEYVNTINLSVDNKWDFTCEVTMQDDPEAVLAEVNAAEDLFEYHILPEGAYSFDKTVTFVKGVDAADFKISVNRVFKNFLPDPDSEKEPYYILPLQLTNISKDGIELNEQNSKLLIKFTHEMEFIGLDDVALTTDDVSSPYTHTGDGQGISGMLDGKTDTWWHSLYNSTAGDETYGYYIQIKLPTEARFFQFAYCTRGSNDNAIPKLATIGGSVDGQTWEVIRADVPCSAVGRGVWDRNMPIVGNINSQLYKYVRFGITESSGDAGGNLKGATGGKCVALSGFELKAGANEPQYKAVY